MNIFPRTLAALLLAVVAPSAYAGEPLASSNDGNNVDQTILGLNFDAHNPLRRCRDVKCYGAGVLRRAYDIGRLTSVVMRDRKSCGELAMAGGDLIDCKVDEDVHDKACHSLKCFGYLAIDDLTERHVVTRISFPTKEACRELEFLLNHFTSCRGDDDPDPVVKSINED